VHDACLEADLDVLPNGDMTEIGERVWKIFIASRAAIAADVHDVLAGNFSFRWAEATC
jgi:hypothetical protein